MQKRPFGSTRRHVAVIGQGAWRMDKARPQAAIAAFQRGLDLGMAHIDVAEMYGDGAAEEVVGAAIAGRRDDVFLVSKVLPQNASIKKMTLACDHSLARLKTDRLDCYLLHWRSAHRLEETIAGFENLCRAGKILSWGVSNFDVADLERAFAITGPGKIACNQVLYHLKERSVEHAVLPWCEQRGLAVTAYSPFGNGEFPRPLDKDGGLLVDIANAHGATARQVALAFLVRARAVFAIPKAARPEHVQDNAGAGDLHLTEAQIAQIDTAFPRGPRPCGLPMI